MSSLLSSNTLAPWFRTDIDPILDVLDEIVNHHSSSSDSKKNKRNLSHIYKSISPLMATDLIETEKEFQVHCDLPGVQNEDVDISVNDGFLVLKAERKANLDDKSHTVHSIERSFGKVQRKIALPTTIDAEKVQATFKNGVLIVSFPKKPQATTVKVPIKFD